MREEAIAGAAATIWLANLRHLVRRSRTLLDAERSRRLSVLVKDRRGHKVTVTQTLNLRSRIKSHVSTSGARHAPGFERLHAPV
jgi:hypothetical protein